MSRGPQRGFSLMEVLLAISILLASLIVLGQMAYVGRQHARSAEQAAWAQVLCRSLMAELLAGITPAESSEWQPIPAAPDWQYRVDVASPEGPGLIAVSVTVAAGGEAGESTEVAGPLGKSFRLTRWMYRPEQAVRGGSEDTFEIDWEALP